MWVVLKRRGVFFGEFLRLTYQSAGSQENRVPRLEKLAGVTSKIAQSNASTNERKPNGISLGGHTACNSNPLPSESYPQCKNLNVLAANGVPAKRNPVRAFSSKIP
jgi:hypothetical protein